LACRNPPESSNTPASGEDDAIDELGAEDLVNHAAGGEDDLRGPQGRAGWKHILAMIYNDLGDEITIDHHHVIAEGEFVVDHMTIHGRHQASTMPLLAGTDATNAPTTRGKTADVIADVGIDLDRRRSVIFAMDAAGDKLFCERIDNDALRFLEVVSAGGASAEVVTEAT
jgi:hypothetical protein